MIESTSSKIVDYNGVRVPKLVQHRGDDAGHARFMDAVTGISLLAVALIPNAKPRFTCSAQITDPRSRETSAFVVAGGI